jgi:hypothetical protein
MKNWRTIITNSFQRWVRGMGTSGVGRGERAERRDGERTKRAAVTVVDPEVPMPRTPPPTAIAIALFAFTAALGAQQRLATAGRVLDGAGKALAGACVTFVGSEPPIYERFAPADRVTATTDEKGRFRAELLPGADYAAWASSAPGVDGSAFVSALAADVRAGSGLELIAATTQPRSELQVEGLDGWPDLAPLRIEVAPALPFVHALPLVLAKGVAPLAAVPPNTEWLVFVRDRDGALLYSWRMLPKPGSMRLDVPPPQSVPVRVRDEQGAAVAGATLRLQVGHRLGGSSRVLEGGGGQGQWRDVGTTGADGTATVRIPASADPFTDAGSDGLLLAAKRDHVAAISGWNGQLLVDGKLVEKLDSRELPFILRHGKSWCGRIRGADGEPLRLAMLQLEGIVVLKMRGTATMASPVAFRARTDAEGAFAFDSLPAELTQASLFVETPEPLAAPAANAARTPRMVRAPALRAPDLGQDLDLDLQALPLLTLRVQGVDDGPARHARVLLVPVPVAKQMFDTAIFQVALDAAGEARVHVQAGRWSVFVCDGTGYAHQIVAIERAEDRQVRLQKLAVVRGTVRMADGSPASGAILYVNSMSGGAGSDDQTQAQRAFGMRVNQWLAGRTTCAADGTFALRFLDMPSMHFDGGARIGWRLYAPMPLKATEGPVDLQLRDGK